MEQTRYLAQVKALHLQDGDLLVVSYDPAEAFPADMIDTLRTWLATQGYQDISILVTKNTIAVHHVPAEHLRRLGWERKR